MIYCRNDSSTRLLFCSSADSPESEAEVTETNPATVPGADQPKCRLVSTAFYSLLKKMMRGQRLCVRTSKAFLMSYKFKKQKKTHSGWWSHGLGGDVSSSSTSCSQILGFSLRNFQRCIYLHLDEINVSHFTQFVQQSYDQLFIQQLPPVQQTWRSFKNTVFHFQVEMFS